MAALFLILFVSLGLSLARQAAAGRIGPRPVPTRGPARSGRRASVALARPHVRATGTYPRASQHGDAGRTGAEAWRVDLPPRSGGGARPCAPFLRASRRRAPGAPGLGRLLPPPPAVTARV